MSGHIQSSNSVDWNTPKWIIDACVRCYGGQIDLDVCSNITSVVNAETNYHLPLNALETSWHIKDNCRIYCNPPYGKLYYSEDYTTFIGSAEHSLLMKEAKLSNETAIAKLKIYNKKHSIKDWVKKAAEEFEGFGAEIIMLTPAAVGVSYFQDIVFKRASGVCFLDGRVKFLVDGEEGGPSPMDLAISYFGTHYQHFNDAFSLHGKCIRL